MNECWQGFIAKVRELARNTLFNNKRGVALMSFYMLVDRDGEPLLWINTACHRIEPSKNAKDVLRRVLGERQIDEVADKFGNALNNTITKG